MLKTLRGPSLFIAQFIEASGPRATAAGLADWAAGLGFKALQVPALDPRLQDLKDLSEADAIRRLEKVSRDSGLEISEIAAHRAGQAMAVHPAYETLPGMERARAGPEAAAGDVARAIRIAAALGAGRVAVFSGGFLWPYIYPYPPIPERMVERAFDELARRWRPLLEAADAAGVDLCFELHPGQDLHDGVTFERFLALVEAAPRARILYDPSHMLLQHMDYLGFIDRHHARIAAFHVKDAEFRPSASSGVYGGHQGWLDRPGRFRSVGDGQVDFRGVFDRLAQHGYDGWATLEWECCLKNAEDGAAEGSRFIAGHIIRVTERAFDQGLRGTLADEAIDETLGIRR
ncbi:sugar phosphate isomerase/epimerase family protein [Alsobacter sp. SYSU BS001988]